MKVKRRSERPRLEWLSVSEGESSISILAHNHKLIVRVFHDGVEVVDQWVSFDTLKAALLTIPIQP